MRWYLLLLVLPAAWVAGAWPSAFGHESVDLGGHLWAIWQATRDGITRTALVNHPDGVDLLPILGGWADVVLGSRLAPLVGL